MIYVRISRKTGHNWRTVKRTYRCTACMGCPFQTDCAKGKETKTITVSLKNQKQRQEIRNGWQQRKEPRSTEATNRGRAGVWANQA
jgi:adenine-specific DNA glycosylase